MTLTPGSFFQAKNHLDIRGDIKILGIKSFLWNQLGIERLGKIYPGGYGVTAASPLLSCSWVFAYLEFFVATEEGRQENHHVWGHHGKVFGISVILLHITEPSAHRVIDKQETGRLELRATEGNAMSQSVRQSPIIFWSSCMSATKLHMWGYQCAYDPVAKRDFKKTKDRNIDYLLQ